MHRTGKEKNKTEGFTNYFMDTDMPSAQISNNSRKTVSQMYTHTLPQLCTSGICIYMPGTPIGTVSLQPAF